MAAQKTKEKLSTKAAIEKVLADAGSPMKAGDIAEKVLPLTSLAGATPRQTIYAVLYTEAKKKSGGIVRKTTKGTFALRAKASAKS